jgi:hypothetical protein
MTFNEQNKQDEQSELPNDSSIPTVSLFDFAEELLFQGTETPSKPNKSSIVAR